MNNRVHSTSPLRQVLAYTVQLTSLIYGLFLFWQIVPFFRGQITSFLVTIYNFVSPLDVKLIGSWDIALSDSHAGVVGFVFYYILGTAGFVSASGLVLLAGQAVSRILLVGWPQFRQEQRDAAEAERLETLRDQRRERRLAARRKAKQKADGSAWLFVVSAVVLWWML
ncbi:hypothetical protein [Burkholderia gladioli]|uniref:hypothetical protein n=1 Tax=Burkholderia gladioli TaxID=28095 RepID=UPI002650E6DD|nr:hypothetical protein [Burkholderia gladioli]MDN7466244.1 hypothetical protein [Burkholderia gladioli]